MKTRKKINEVIPNWMLGEGIFNALQSFPVPWQYENISASLDLEYHGNISGDKFVSPLVDKILTDSTLSDADLINLAGVIYTLYGKNWEKEWETMSIEFNPIENYSMVEKMTDDITTIEHGLTHTRTDNTTHTKTGTETTTPNLTERETPNLTENVSPNVTNSGTSSVYGFNSSSPVPSNGSTATQSGTTTTTNTGTTTTTRTGNEILTHNTSDKDTGTVTDKDTGTDKNTHNYTLTRSGNIGVTTSQQMLQSSRDLYMWNIFYTVIFPDIDKVISLPIY